MDYGANFTEPRVEGHAVVFGSMEVPGYEAPGGEPYAAMLVVPRFLWERAGSPESVVVRLLTGEEASRFPMPMQNAWLEPIKEGE